MTTVKIVIESLGEISSPAILLQELAEIIQEMKQAELTRNRVNIGGEFSNITIITESD